MSRSMAPVEMGTPVGEFARELQNLKERSGLTLQAIAWRSGVSAPTLSRACNGRELPSWRTVEALVGECGGDLGRWRHRFNELQAAVAGRRPDEDELLLQAQRRWTPSRPCVPLSETIEGPDEYRMWLRILKRFSRRSYRELAALSHAGQRPWSASAFSSLLSGSRPISPPCVAAFLMACGVARYSDLCSWLYVIPTASRAEQAEVHSVAIDLHTTYRAALRGWQGPDGRTTGEHLAALVEQDTLSLSHLERVVVGLSRTSRPADIVVVTRSGLMLANSGGFISDPIAKKARLDMLHAGWRPLTYYPGAAQPWPCECAHCGESAAPTLQAVLAGAECTACDPQDRLLTQTYQLPIPATARRSPHTETP